MDTFTIILILTSVIALSLILGNKFAIYLPELSEKMDRKPFNCRPCLTFHLIWAIASVCALMTQNAQIALGGIIAAFIVFGVVKYMDKRKIEK